MTAVSLCMIVKNEEAVLSRCLLGTAGIADEIVIVDTGSTDGTREIAARFTDKIYSFPWQDDFAAARNFSFSKGTGEYLLWLDADDVIPEGERGKFLELKKRILREQPDVVMVPYVVGYKEDGTPASFFYRERFLRNCPAAKWRGKVHEAVAHFGKVIYGDCRVEHHKEAVADPGRNLRILEGLKKSGQMGPREWCYYGKELCFHRRYEEAAAVLSWFLSWADWLGAGWEFERADAGRYLRYAVYQSMRNCHWTF